MNTARAYRSYEEFAREELRETSGVWRLHEVMDDLLVGDELDKDLFESWRHDADDDEEIEDADEKDTDDADADDKSGDEYEGRKPPPAPTE